MAPASGSPVGSVRFSPRPAHQLPCGPVHARLGRNGTIVWAVDEAQIDPLLGHAMADVSSALVTVIPTLPIYTLPPVVRWHRDHTLGGSELFAADLTVPGLIDVRVPACLVTDEVAREVARHATLVLEILMSPITGQQRATA